MAIRSTNPTTGQTIRTFEPLSDREVESRLQRASEAFRIYRKSPFEERSRRLHRAAEILSADKEQLARLVTTEMGKPVRAAVAEIEKCAWNCRFYADHGRELLADELTETDAIRSFIRYQPLGPILAVMPWNFPFWQVFRFAAPALMAGNVVLLKHASNVPQSALAIEDILRRAGFPEGTFQALLIPSDRVEALLADPRIKATTLTGSTPAGARVAGAAASHIKKAVLELGGSDPFIVMPSANLDDAINVGVKARIINNGQSCIAAKRFILAEPIADEFEERFVRAMRVVKIGDPLEPATELGPLATEDIAETLQHQVDETVAAGARLLLGGKRLQRDGFYFAPTVITDVPPASPAYREELFGPVASIYRVQDPEEAIRLANDTQFGLGSSVWTNDPEERALFIDEIEAGLVWVNGMVSSDPRLPFGGIKNSGFGRELSAYGIREFVNIKTVWLSEGCVPPYCETE